MQVDNYIHVITHNKHNDTIKVLKVIKKAISKLVLKMIFINIVFGIL